MSRRASGLPDLAASIAAYEAWMRDRLGDTLVEKDLKRKHKRMRKHPFLFLRATCWRWAEAAPFLCPELIDAPAAPSVGDAHAGNFGLWRDDGSRLVWGVNDFDEAARVAWPLDLIRLCASIALAAPRPGARTVAEIALAAYAKAIVDPHPFVLERDHLWLRDAFVADDAHREEFWHELQSAPAAASVPQPIHDALIARLPEPELTVKISAREAGAGSLGRPRFTAWCEHRGGPLALEAKGLLPSCWKTGRERGLAARIVNGRFRAPDPTLRYQPHMVTRRLAPNNRKLTFTEISVALRTRLIEAMAAELAAIHAETDALQAAILTDLEARKPGWLGKAVERVARWTREEHADYARSGDGG